MVCKADSPRELERAPVGVLSGTTLISPLSDPRLDQHRGTTKTSYPIASECRTISAVMLATVELSSVWTAPWARIRLLAATPQMVSGCAVAGPPPPPVLPPARGRRTARGQARM